MSDPVAGGRRDGRGRDPEEVLSQALRAMAGGGRREGPPGRDERDAPSGSDAGAAGGGDARPGRPSWLSRLTALQVVLLSVTVGLALGMVTGIVVLLAR